MSEYLESAGMWHAAGTAALDDRLVEEALGDLLKAEATRSGQLPVRSAMRSCHGFFACRRR